MYCAHKYILRMNIFFASFCLLLCLNGNNNRMWGRGYFACYKWPPHTNWERKKWLLWETLIFLEFVLYMLLTHMPSYMCACFLGGLKLKGFLLWFFRLLQHSNEKNRNTREITYVYYTGICLLGWQNKMRHRLVVTRNAAFLIWLIDEPYSKSYSAMWVNKIQRVYSSWCEQEQKRFEFQLGAFFYCNVASSMQN